MPGAFREWTTSSKEILKCLFPLLPQLFIRPFLETDLDPFWHTLDPEGGRTTRAGAAYTGKERNLLSDMIRLSPCT